MAAVLFVYLFMGLFVYGFICLWVYLFMGHLWVKKHADFSFNAFSPS
jgi:hypothetical protein